MSTIDATIVLVYLAVMMFIGFFVGRNNKSQEDYFLAGRSMHWFPVTLSIAATMISANSFIGGPGWAYTDGIQPFMQNITVPLACFIAIYVTVPVFYRLRVSSVYEYMELRLGGMTRLLTVLQHFINSLIQTSSMVFIPALIIQTITGWSLQLIVPLIVLCSIIYTLAGGIKAVIWTDAIQMIVLWGGMIIILIVAVSSTGLGFTETIAQAAAAGKYDAFIFTTDYTKTNGFLASCFGIFMWTRYFCFDQCQMQRVLTSSSMKGVKRSFLTSAILMNVMYFFMLFVGTMFFVFYGGKEFATSNEIMIGFILNNLPAGILGLVVAAAFAAAMSSVDSLLNSMTTVFTKDIYEKYFSKEKGVTSSLKQTMVITAILGVIVIVIVLLGFSGTVKSVIDVVGKYVSFFAGPALGAFLMALFTRKANDRGVAIGFIAGIIGGFVIGGGLQVSWLITPFIGCAITVILGYICSCVIPSSKTEAEIVPYTALGMRNKMIAEKADKENGVSLLPFSMDKYAVGLLIFFVAQYIFLFLIR